MRYWVFLCDKGTETECFARKLLGTSGKMLRTVEQIRKGDICFLYNRETDVLFGPFVAESDGKENIEPKAWGGEYPAQVRVGWKAITAILNASKEFDFLHKLELSDLEGLRILAKLALKWVE
jgi:hypothetical protein